MSVIIPGKLSGFSTKLDYREHFPDLTSTAFVEVLKPDHRRWAVMTAQRGTAGYDISINPGPKPGTDFNVTAQFPQIFCFRELGPLVQGNWWFRNAAGVNSVTVYEIFVIEG